MRLVRPAALVGFFVATTWLASVAWAAGPLGGSGNTIQTSDYTIDMFQGPVLAGSRTTALGGAFAGLAEGVDGNAVNAAAPAVRMPWSVDWFDYDWTVGITMPGTLNRTDFDNNGQTGFTYRDFSFGTVGLNTQFGAWGFGVLADIQQYGLQDRSSTDEVPPDLSATLTRGHVLGGRAAFNGQLTVGVGIRFASLTLSANAEANGTGKTRDLFRTGGISPEAGLIWAPHSQPWRVGLTGRGPLLQSEDKPADAVEPNAAGDTVVGTMYLPSRIDLPWEVEAGLAIQIGRRPLNQPWLNPNELLEPLKNAHREAHRKRVAAGTPSKELDARRIAESRQIKLARKQNRAGLKARYRSLARQKLLISTSVLVSGPVANAVGVESFLKQVVDRSGQHVSVTPRLGVETEPIEGWLQVRTGTYLEPTRFRGGAARVHGTLGYDLRVLDWSVFGLLDDDATWRIGGAIDGARDYFGWSLAAGLWH